MKKDGFKFSSMTVYINPSFFHLEVPKERREVVLVLLVLFVDLGGYLFNLVVGLGGWS